MPVPMTLTVEVPVEAANVNCFEAAVFKLLSQVARQMWQAFVRSVEQRAEAEHEGRLKRKGRERKRLWTTAGWVEFERQRYTHPAEEQSLLVFDVRMGLKPYQTATEAARIQVAQLTARAASYAQAQEALAAQKGDAPSVSTVWNWTQQVGANLAQAAKAERRAFTQEDRLPGTEVEAPAFVGIEADSTMIHAWHRKAVHHEVYLGLSYTGKAAVGKRRRLQDKLTVTAVGSSVAFGEELFLKVQGAHNVCEAPTVLFASDGASVLEGLRDTHFPHAHQQTDQAHVTRKVREAYGPGGSSQARRMLKLLYGEKRTRFEAWLQRDAECLPERREALREMAQYVLPRWDQIFTARRLRRAGAPGLPVHVSGTGAIERNVATVVGHRLKRRGMSWTARGADHILRLRQRPLLQNF